MLVSMSAESQSFVTDAWLHRITGTGYSFKLCFFCGPKQSPILSDEWLPRERRDKMHSVPLILGVSSSWFLTTWFNHQTGFHVVPSSWWAENLCRHEILTVFLSVLLCLPPGAATVYLGFLVVFSWLEIKRAKTEITLHRAIEKINRKNTPPPFCAFLT